MNNKISIIILCLNLVHLLKDTVHSVTGQQAIINGDVELEYIVCDGGAVDDYMAGCFDSEIGKP